MLNFRDIGSKSLWTADTIRLFFLFIGHCTSSIITIFKWWSSRSKASFIKTLYFSGVRLVVPMVIISGLLGMSLGLGLYGILNEYHMGKQALLVAQNTAITNIAPLLIGIILSIQSALNLINSNIHKFHHAPNEVVYEHILPIMGGILITGILLYTYTLMAFLLGIYSTFHFILNIDVYDNLLHLASNISLHSIDYSVFKVWLFSTITALVTGFYYYEITRREISLRQAVSRIMTRSLLCIIFTSVYLNIYML